MTSRGRCITAFVFACTLAATSGCLRVGMRWNKDDPPTLERLLQAGNEALRAGRYDEAIRQFDSALTRSPGHPNFLVNKSVALRLRGAARYNASRKLTDERAGAVEKEAAGRDFRDAEAVANEALERIDSRAIPELAQAGEYDTLKENAYFARAEALRLLASTFDKPRAEEALAATHEYMKIERSGEKRTKAQLGAAQMLLDAGRGEQGAAEYKKILAEDADNIDALLGAGIALAQSGDAAKYREAEPYLRRFIERAPDIHPLKASARDTLEHMNRQEPRSQGRPDGARGVLGRRAP